MGLPPEIRPSILLLALTLAAAGSACKKQSQKSGTEAALARTMTINGKVFTPEGVPVAGAAIHISGSETIVSETGSDGSWRVDLNDGQITALSAAHPEDPGSFYLYFRTTRGTVLTGVTSRLRYDASGYRSLDTLTLHPPQTVTGHVMLLAHGQDLQPAASVQVRLGRSVVFTNSAGQFTANGVPTGRLPLLVSRPGYRSLVTEADTSPGRLEESLGKPLVLLPERGITGTMIALPAGDLRERVRSGHPLKRSFHVVASTGVTRVRYGHRPPEDSGDGWEPLPATIDHDFPGEGRQVFYYQFGGPDPAELSPVYELPVELDLFGDYAGPVLGEDGQSSGHRVRVRINPPPAAAMMRLATDATGLGEAPWQPSLAETTWDFTPDPAQPEVTEQALWVQFRDNAGHESAAWEGKVNLRLFAGVAWDIAGGRPMVNSPRVDISTNLPENIRYLRIAADPDLLAESPWQGAASSLSYRIPARQDPVSLMPMVQGEQTLYMQVQDAGGFISGVYPRSVIVDRFPTDGVPFTINGGVPVTPLRTVQLQLYPPANSKEMRIFAVEAGSSSGGFSGFSDGFTFETFSGSAQINLWLKVSNEHTFTFNKAGVHDLYVQFRDEQNLASKVFHDTIRILPFDPAEPLASGSFTINDGATTTTDKTLKLKFTVPPQASYMEIRTTTPSGSDNGPFQAAAATMDYVVSSVGLKTFWVRFRTIDGNNGPWIFRQITVTAAP